MFLRNEGVFSFHKSFPSFHPHYPPESFLGLLCVEKGGNDNVGKKMVRMGGDRLGPFITESKTGSPRPVDNLPRKSKCFFYNELTPIEK